ncbi:MAG: septal ring lytic transglycosylase RlpA family protein [Solirubrobacterales bacterium]
MNRSLKTFGSGFLMLCAIFTFSAVAAVVSPASAKTGATTLKVKVAPKKVRLGKSVAIHGVSGARGRHKVSLLFRGAGTSSWSRVKKLTTDLRGAYETDVKARKNGAFKVTTSAGVTSPTRKIRVRSKLKLGSVNRYVKLGGKLGIRGVVRPAGVRRIKVVVNGAGKTIRTKTKKHGGFAVKWAPKTSGSYRVRVFSANNKVAIGDASRRVRVFGLRPGHASYYGPGLYGNGVACGGTLTPGTMGVAHKTLPCGTKVTIRYEGRTVTVPVIDRGPYIAGRDWDLTEATRNALGFGGVGTVWTNR